MKKIFVMLSIILLLAGCSENNDVATANTTTQTSLESVEDTTVATTTSVTTTSTTIATTQATTTTDSVATTTTPSTTSTNLATSTKPATTTVTTTTEKLVAVQSQTQPSGQVLSLVSFTNPLQRNNDATITIKGKPGEDYDINVYYSSGASKAEGLENKPANPDGTVTWTWHVGGKTNPGNYHIDIIGGNEKLRVELNVIE